MSDKPESNRSGVSLLSNKIAEYYYLWKGVAFIVTIIGVGFYWLIREKEESPIHISLVATLIATPIVIIAALATGVYLIKERLPNTKQMRSMGAYFCSMLDTAYATKDLSALIIFQFILRTTFNAFVIAVLLITIDDKQLVEPQLEKWKTMCYTRFILVETYFLVAVFTVIVGLRSSFITTSEKGKNQIRNTILLPSILDCVFICMISSTDFSLRDDFHLAYIIPMASSWILGKRGRAKEIVLTIIVCLIARFVFVAFFAYNAGISETLFPISEKFPFLPSISQYLLPPVVFWMALAGPFAALRYFHEKATDSKDELIKEKEILDIVTRHIDYPVFMKDRNRVFLYANEPLAKRLKLTPGEIVGKTDAQLGIDCNAYLQSDLAALHPPKDNPKFVSRTIEPNFDRNDESNPKILTIKTPVKTESGDVSGLVGMCEPGMPRVVMETAGRLFDQMPYYSSLKDVDGYIQWANEAFCKKDVNIERNALLEMNKGRGARDRDLYSPEFAERFRRDDYLVMQNAKNAIMENVELPSDHQIDPVFAGTIRREESHYFKAQQREASVHVTKVPWLSESKDDVLGVLVYFHELDEKSSFKGS